MDHGARSGEGLALGEATQRAGGFTMSEHRRHPAGDVEPGRHHGGCDMWRWVWLLVLVTAVLVAADVLGLARALVSGHPVLWTITVRRADHDVSRQRRYGGESG
jgi:hypothetical protein